MRPACADHRRADLCHRNRRARHRRAQADARRCDRTLAERLRTAERYAADLAAQIEAGQIVMDRIGQIVSAATMVAPKDARPEPVAPEPTPISRMASAADAAAAIRQRAARRLEGQAA